MIKITILTGKYIGKTVYAYECRNADGIITSYEVPIFGNVRYHAEDISK